LDREHMVTIAVVNQKGGVGKTTTAVNLAVGLGLLGWRVLLVDLDPQAHSTLALRIDADEIPAHRTVASLFQDGPIQDILVGTIEPNLKMVPASIHLATAVETLYSVIFREVKLKKALEAVENEFDYVIFDCAPTLSVLSINAIVAARHVLIPTRLSMYSLDGLNALLNTISAVKQDGEYDWRILLTQVKGYGKERQAIAWSYLEPVAQNILETRIRETEAIEKSQMNEDEDVPMAVVMNPKSSSRGAEDYKALVREVEKLWPA
jgi:chromosome partitioning protein